MFYTTLPDLSLLLREVKARTQYRNLNGALNSLLTGPCLTKSSLYNPGLPALGMVLLTVGWALLHLVMIKKMPDRHAHRPADLSKSTTRLLLYDSKLCQVDN